MSHQQYTYFREQDEPGLYLVADSPQAGVNYTCDIVVVHGLSGGPTSTWQHPETKTIWFRDLLPDDIMGAAHGGRARIWTFGYNANVAFGASPRTGAFNFAVLLLERIRVARKGFEHLKLIWVCHSLGGIVVKSALIEAQLNIDYKSILDSTVGILFLGTPHQGSQAASLANIAVKIAKRVPFVSPNAGLVDCLKRDSDYLFQRVSQFSNVRGSIRICSFYETQLIGRQMIVEQFSAVTGLQGERSMPLHADHRGLCRYRNRDDQNYVVVRDNIIELMSSITVDRRFPRRILGRHSPNPSGTDWDMGSITASMDDTSIHENHSEYMNDRYDRSRSPQYGGLPSPRRTPRYREYRPPQNQYHSPNPSTSNLHPYDGYGPDGYASREPSPVGSDRHPSWPTTQEPPDRSRDAGSPPRQGRPASNSFSTEVPPPPFRTAPPPPTAVDYSESADDKFPSHDWSSTSGVPPRAASPHYSHRKPPRSVTPPASATSRPSSPAYSYSEPPSWAVNWRSADDIHDMEEVETISLTGRPARRAREPPRSSPPARAVSPPASPPKEPTPPPRRPSPPIPTPPKVEQPPEASEDVGERESWICDVCLKKVVFDAFRATCETCFDYALCKPCYDKGLVSKEHKDSHRVRLVSSTEYLEPSDLVYAERAVYPEWSPGRRQPNWSEDGRFRQRWLHLREKPSHVRFMAMNINPGHYTVSFWLKFRLSEHVTPGVLEKLKESSLCKLRIAVGVPIGNRPFVKEPKEDPFNELYQTGKAESFQLNVPSDVENSGHRVEYEGSVSMTRVVYLQGPQRVMGFMMDWSDVQEFQRLEDEVISMSLGWIRLEQLTDYVEPPPSATPPPAPAKQTNTEDSDTTTSLDVIIAALRMQQESEEEQASLNYVYAILAQQLQQQARADQQVTVGDVYRAIAAQRMREEAEERRQNFVAAATLVRMQAYLEEQERIKREEQEQQQRRLLGMVYLRALMR